MTSRGQKHDREAARRSRAEEKRLRRQARRDGDAAGPTLELQPEPIQSEPAQPGPAQAESQIPPRRW
jgi:hypothetical protein